MKAKLLALAERVRQKIIAQATALQWALAAPAVALLAHPALAKLPEAQLPTDGMNGDTCTDGAFLCGIGSYAKTGLGYLLIVGAVCYLAYYIIGMSVKFIAYSNGRDSLGHVMELLIVGGIIAGLVVVVAYLATQYMV